MSESCFDWMMVGDGLTIGGRGGAGGNGDVVRERGNSLEYWDINARSGRDLWIDDDDIDAGDGAARWWGELLGKCDDNWS